MSSVLLTILGLLVIAGAPLIGLSQLVTFWIVVIVIGVYLLITRKL